MKQYHDLLQSILDEHDTNKKERTGTGTISRFGEMLKFDLREGFPAITTKKLAWKGVVSELIWFLRGSSSLFDLREILHGPQNRYDESLKTIWDANYNQQAKDLGYNNGDMGDIYGVQWRNFGKETLELVDETAKVAVTDKFPVNGVDQVKLVLDEAKVNPQSRRLIVSAWNPKVVWDYSDEYIKVKKAALPPCHMLFQLNITEDGYLDLLWFQRSVDSFLGLPFNIASYALLTHKFARMLNLTPRHLIGQLGNVHIYDNHINQVREQLARLEYPLPKLEMSPHLKTLEDFEKSSINDYILVGYQHHETIKAKMAV